MRKNLIAMSVATLVAGLGFSSGASAVVTVGAATNATAEVFTKAGVGHQLIVPYYNVLNGNATLFNIVNSDTVNGKAVKIRFRGASNSDDVFDFQLYMSPGDAWVANISLGADGRAILTSPDKSCTLPAGVGSGSGNSFVTARLPSTFTDANKAAQTTEGYIEIFNMADVPPLGAGSLFQSIVHVNGLPPCNGGGSAAQQNAASVFFNPGSGTLATDSATPEATFGFAAPSTGLFANWTIINVPKSGAASGEAEAIVATTPNPIGGGQPVPGRGNIVFFPQTATPPAAGVVDASTADPALRTLLVTNDLGAAYVANGGTPIISASSFDLPDLSTPYILTAFPGVTPVAPAVQAEALTRSLATMNVMNEFINDPIITANTDWVLSLPTRRYSIALDYRGATPLRAYTTFANRDYFTPGNTSVSNFQICTATGGVTYRDREEFLATGTAFVISPNPATPGFSLCGEDSVLTFNATAGASVLGATIAATNFNTGNVKNGWASVATPGLATGGGAGVNAPSAGGNGLPVVGKAFVRASNPAVSAGIAANFGASYEHRYTRPVNP